MHSRRVTVTFVLLAIALFLSGAWLAMFTPFLLKILLPPFSQHATKIVYLPGAAVLLGLLLGWLGSFVRQIAVIAGVLLAARLTIATTMCICSEDLRTGGDENLLLLGALEAAAIVLVAACSVLFPFWIGRGAGDVDRRPFLFLGFWFLGYVAGFVSYPLAVEPYFLIAQQSLILHIGLGGVGAVYLVVFFLMYAAATASGDVSRQAAETPWIRRLQWILLGGFPGFVAVGATNYISAEVAPIPLLWMLPLAVLQLSWVVAFARMSASSPGKVGWLLQGLGAIPLLTTIWIVHEVFRDNSGPWMAGLVASLLLSVYLPHRVTIVAQAALLAVVLAQMYGGYPIGTYWTILTHLSMCALVAWGCHGDAVKIAPTPDRLPEFVLCTQGGFLVMTVLFVTLAPVVFTYSIIEYPLALGGCLVMRSLTSEMAKRSLAGLRWT